MTERKALDFGNLDDFAPRSPLQTASSETKRAVDQIASFPSREAAEDSQINIKAPVVVLENFKAMAKAERYKHGEFLQILMDAYKNRREA